MKVDTSQFEEEHGKKPNGRGTWIFDVVVENRNRRGSFLTATVTVDDLYKEAKKDLKRLVSNKLQLESGFEIVEVLLLP